jgi:hypothetical protein
LCRPGEEAIAPHQPRAVVRGDVRTIGQAGEIRRVDALSAPSSKPIAMELSIDEIGTHRFAMAGRPQRTELLILRVAAFGTWSMSGGKRSGFIEEEQLCIAVRLHDFSVAATELEDARDPTAHLPRPHDALVIIVQDPTVTHHETTPRERDDFAERRDPVLQRVTNAA